VLYTKKHSAVLLIRPADAEYIPDLPITAGTIPAVIGKYYCL